MNMDIIYLFITILSILLLFLIISLIKNKKNKTVLKETERELLDLKDEYILLKKSNKKKNLDNESKDILNSVNKNIQKIAAKNKHPNDQFIINISHEMRTPRC